MPPILVRDVVVGEALEPLESDSEDIAVAAGSHVSQAEQSSLPPMRQVALQDDAHGHGDEIELELMLGFESVTRAGVLLQFSD